MALGKKNDLLHLADSNQIITFKIVSLGVKVSQNAARTHLNQTLHVPHSQTLKAKGHKCEPVKEASNSTRRGKKYILLEQDPCILGTTTRLFHAASAEGAHIVTCLSRLKRRQAYFGW